MKIGIFGDSFGTANNMPVTEKSRPWFDYVGDQHEIFNYCESGSSLYWSYDKYLSTDCQFDKIIFLVTFPGRLRILTTECEKNYPDQVTHYDHAKGLLEYAIRNNHTRRIMLYRTAINYFLHYQDQKQEKLNHQLLLEKIRQIPNCLVIPNFKESFPNESNYSYLFQISEIDDNYYRDQLTENKNFTFYDARHCHFNDENNKIFGDHILKWIDTGEWKLDISEYQNPSDSFDYYISSSFASGKS